MERDVSKSTLISENEVGLSTLCDFCICVEDNRF